MLCQDHQWNQVAMFLVFLFLRATEEQAEGSLVAKSMFEQNCKLTKGGFNNCAIPC